MGTVSIDIQGMRALVQGAEQAIGAIPGDQGSVRGSLSRVMLSTSAVSPADNVVGWLQGEIVGLRRRLAMAVAIEASTPGVQSFVQFDEGTISTKTPAQAQALADQVAQAIKDGAEIDPALLKVLQDNAVDPYFGSALAKQVSPEQIALFVQNMGTRRTTMATYEQDPDELAAYDATYGATLDALATALGVATMQTGDDLKLPSNYNQTWLDAMTKEGVTRPGQASWLALVMSRGTWSKDFTVDITKGIYQHEKDVNLPGMWQSDSYMGMGSGYIGAVAPGGAEVYDPLALALLAVGRNADASMELFGTGDTTTVQVDGKDVTVNAFMKYLIADRRWPTDDGDGAKQAIAAGMTPQLGGSTDSMLVAQYAKAIIDFKIAEIEARADDGGNWFSDIGHLVLDGLGLIPVVGEPVDAINGIWYYAEGNVIDGSLSMAAVIPGLGWAATGGKWTRKGAHALEAGSKLLTRDGKVFDETVEAFQLLAKGENVAPGVFKFDNVADFNRAANNPHPGVTYQYKDLAWSTDEFGRTTSVQGKLSLDSPGRDTGLQRDIGNGPGAKDSDVGFHLIADSLGGPTNKLNVLPGNGKPIDDGLANLNQGAYASMERKLRQALKDGKDVELDLTPVYPTHAPGSAAPIRPDSFRVTTWVNGRIEVYTFINK